MDLVGDGVDAAEERVLARDALAPQDLDELLARQRPLQLLSIEQLLLQLLERLQRAQRVSATTPRQHAHAQRDLLPPRLDKLGSASAISATVARDNEVSDAA